MKVFYDISLLGMGYHDSRARSGAFRVVETLAKELILLPQCEIHFCGLYDLYTLFNAIDYQKVTKIFKNIPFIKPDSSYFKKKSHLYKMSVLEDRLNGSNDISLTEKLLLKSKFQYERVRQKFYTPQNRDFFPLEALNRADIYHTPFFPISKEVKNSHVKSKFITCYDLIPVNRPEYCHEGVVTRMHEILDSMTPETWILCISQSGRNELLNYMGNRIDEKKAIVTELAAADFFYRSTNIQLNALIRKKYGIPDGPFILSLCTLEPRKNIERAIEAFAMLVQQQHLPDLSLVLVGNKGFKSQELIDGIVYDDAIKKRIIITGFIVDADLAPLYSEAIMFVYPSFYEGFGLPPLEAMQCGTPVITSNTTSLPEVVGNAGIMINPTDTDALCQAMWDIYSKPALQQQLSVNGIDRAKQFSWKKCAEKTVAAYKNSLQI